MMKHDDYIKRLIEVYNKIDWTKQQVTFVKSSCAHEYHYHTSDALIKRFCQLTNIEIHSYMDDTDN